MRARVALLVGVLAVLVAAQGCGGSTPTEGSVTQPQAVSEAGATSAPVSTEPGGESAPSESAPDQTQPAATDEPAPPAVPTVRLVGGIPEGGPVRIEARSGERVRFRVVSDTPDEVHVHGYDLEASVGPGEPAAFSFVADLEGIFEVETHESGEVIARIVVSP